MNRIIFILLLVSFACQVRSQETNRNQISSVPVTARYEIVQSELGAKYTLKIDKYTGRVFQLTKDENEDLTWSPILSLDALSDEEAAGKVNFQIFTSGLGVRFTFLLNVNTGKTWQLANDEEFGLFWFGID